MKRLRVRWQTAMNGQIAVDKWRAGGFHLVLMDIQMPVMNGLAATKEIRRLERVNGIGVFSEVVSPEEEGEGRGEKVPKKMGDVEVEDTEGEQNGELAAAKRGSKSVTDDRLAVSSALFKSPIIIVALTASSLQSDRHEALAAGCNDFLTKPVDFVWLERKVKEWGCMQALIDFEGWRAWKVLVAKEEEVRKPVSTPFEDLWAVMLTFWIGEDGRTARARAAPRGKGEAADGEDGCAAGEGAGEEGGGGAGEGEGEGEEEK